MQHFIIKSFTHSINEYISFLQNSISKVNIIPHVTTLFQAILKHWHWIFNKNFVQQKLR